MKHIQNNQKSVIITNLYTVLKKFLGKKILNQKSWDFFQMLVISIKRTIP
jgi:hypothetical protein